MEKIKKFINYFIKEWALFIILAIGLPLIITNFVTRTTVSGTSMLPTYVDGEKLWLSKVSELKNGDVIVANCSNSEEKFYIIKRLIASPGDRIVIAGNDIYVNDELLKENYIKDKNWNDDYLFNLDVTLGKDEYFLMGDNRIESMDSRIIGPVNRENILGKIIDIF